MGFEIVRDDKKIIEVRYLNEHVAEVLFEDGTMETTSDVYEASLEAERENPSNLTEDCILEDDSPYDLEGWGLFDIEDELDTYVDLKEADEHESGKKKVRPGDLVVVTSFYSPQSRSRVEKRHYVVVIYEYNDRGEHVGYALSSQFQKANKFNQDKPRFYDSLYIKDTASILGTRKTISSKEAIINVGDKVTFTDNDLSGHWFKGKVSHEFFDFIKNAARNVRTGKNKEVYWEK